MWQRIWITVLVIQGCARTSFGAVHEFALADQNTDPVSPVSLPGDNVCPWTLPLCAQGLSLSFHARKLPHTNQPDVHSYLLSSGGHSPLSNGLYVRENMGLDLETGVALEDKLWRLRFDVAENEWFHYSMTWSSDAGLKVYVDGRLVEREVEITTRPFVKMAFDPFRNLTVGRSNDLIERGAVNFAMYGVKVEDRIWTEEEVTTNAGSKPPVACITRLPDGQPSSPTDGIVGCHSHCLVENTRLFNYQTSCTCLPDDFVMAADKVVCDESSLKVEALTSSIAVVEKFSLQVDMSKTELLTGEFVELKLSTDAPGEVFYTLHFGDQTQRSTDAVSIYHAWDQVGSYNIFIEARYGKMTAFKALEVKVSERDLGTKPTILQTYPSQREDSPNVQFSVTTTGTPPLLCSADFGDRNRTEFTVEVEDVFLSTIHHQYDLPGFYQVMVRCENNYGRAEKTLSAVTWDPELHEPFWDREMDLGLPLHGSADMLNDIQVQVGGQVVEFYREANSISVPSSVFSSSRLYSVQVFTGEAPSSLLRRALVYMQRQGRVDQFSIDPKHGKVSDDYTLRTTVLGDPLFMELRTNEMEKFFMLKEEKTQDLEIKLTKPYQSTGMYGITLKLCNQIWCDTKTDTISVETPIHNVKLMTTDVYSIDEEVRFQISPNLNAIQPEATQPLDRLVVTIDYGDGITETKLLTSEGKDYTEYSIWHSYSRYSIFHGKATFSNNISDVSKPFSVQVGQNLTFVDLTTKTERLNTAVSSEAVVRMFCPTGSTRHYQLDMGDGTYAMYPESADWTSIVPHGIKPKFQVLNDGDITVKHTYSKPGYYKVKVKVLNDFGSVESILCPEIIVSNPPSHSCHSPQVSFQGIDHEKVLEKAYSENITLSMVTLSECSDNKTARYTWRLQRQGADKDLIRPQEPCIFRSGNPQLFLEPFRLEYGLYWITGCAELSESELYYTCLTVRVRVTTSPLKAVIAGEDPKRSDINMPNPVVININGSGDPDVKGMPDESRFYILCSTDSSKARLKDLGTDIENIKRQSSEVATKGSITVYDFEESCFGGNQTKISLVSLVNWNFTIPMEVYEDTASLDYYIRLITIKSERSAILDHRVVIWDPSLTDPDNFDPNALDDLLEKDVSGALFLITACAGNLNDRDEEGDDVDQDALDEKKAKAMAIRAKMIESLEKVAGGKAENPSQVLGCAKALTSVTSKADEVTQEAKDKAANSLEGVAGMADGKMMNQSDISQVADVTGNVVNGVSNLLPGAISEEDAYKMVMKQQERREKSKRRKRRALGLENELMVEEWEVDQEECGINDEDWEILKIVDKQKCPWIHPYFTNKLADQRRAEKRRQIKIMREANKKLTKKCTGATKGVGGAIMRKQEEGKSMEFGSANLQVKLKKQKPGEEPVPLESATGAIAAPPGMDGGMMFTAMPNNPYTAEEGENGVTSGVVGLDMVSADGKPKSVNDSKEPFKIEIPSKDLNASRPLEFGMFTSINVDKKNFHSINITKKDQHMRLYIRPDDKQDVYKVCYNLTLQPNETYPGFCEDVPKTGPLPQTLDPKLEDNWRHTVTPPFHMTKMDNVTLKLSIKLIGARVVIPIKESYHNYSFLSYNLACRYYNETEEKWRDNGCTLSMNSTMNKTICLCSHLTNFGSDFVVPPNTIDFSTVWAKFAKLNENAAVFSTVITILCLYLIALVWCRYKDKQDIVKWGAKPLEDNLPSDSYHYQIAVHTGMRRGASCKSRISFVLSGDDSDTGVRELYDGQRKLFQRGSVQNFVLSVESRLGPLTFLRIWHDNKGKGKYRSWYLDHIQVNDLQTGERYFFICNRWLAVEEDDGMVERIIPVAGFDDMASFSQLFNTSVKKKLTNEHIWFSIVSRPTRSSFTRVQRLSCCLSLLFLTMITNCMWFNTGDEPDQKQTAINLGPFSFTLQELFVSVMGTLIVFPVNLLMVSIFRKCKAKKNTVAQKHQQVNKSKKMRWRKIDPDSALWSGREKSKAQKFKDSMKNIITFHRTTKYTNPDDELLAKKKKKPFLFPHWMLYVAYILCFLSITASAFFTILYSMEWGAELANKWLATFVLSFFENVVIVQPVKVLLLAAFISFILRKPELEDEQDFLDETMNNIPERGAEDMRKSTVDLEKIVLQRKTAATHLRPPDMESLRAARETRLMEIKMEDIIKEMSAYMCFVLVLFFLSYQTRSKNSYGMGFIMKDLFTDNFDMITSHQKFYDYADKYLIPNLYPTEWYNGQVLRWREAICINDGTFNTVRVGVPRLRQMRVKKHTCKVQEEMVSIIDHCRGSYGWLDDDTKPYLEGWVKPPEENVTDLKKTISPWVYRSSLKLKNEPYMATISTYKGGGYAIDLGIRREDTEAIFKNLYETSWVDTLTRAIFIEFTLYNANVNLFTSVRMTAEFMASGGVETRTEYKVFRLYSYVGGMGVVVLIAEIIFIIFFLYFLYRECKRLKDERWMYFKNFWNLLEFATMVATITAIAMYIMKKILAELAMGALRETGSAEFVNFNTIALWDELYVVLLACLVFFATIKIIKILKFNRRMGILGSTIKQATKDLKVFSIAFLIYFFAFCQFAYLLFGREMGTYGNFVGACESMFAFALGDFAFEDMKNAQKYLGPIFFFLYIGVVYFVLMGIFLTIINDAFVQVKANADLQSNDFELVEFMVRRAKGMFGCIGNMGGKKDGQEESDDEDDQSRDTVSIKSSKL